MRIADENSQGRDADVTASFLAAPPCLLNVDKLLLLHQTGFINHCEKNMAEKNSTIYDECQTQSAEVFGLALRTDS